MSYGATIWSGMRQWSLVLPPSRPSDKQLAEIQQRMGDISKEAPVAVLGSTVEFRDLLAQAGFTNIYVFEKDIEFHRQTDEARIYKTSEHLVVGDWLHSLPLHKSAFAMILSDLTSGNIPYDRREEFHAAVAAALAPEGLFFDRMLTHPIQHERLTDLARKFDARAVNLASVNDFSCQFLFCSELLSLSDTVDSSEFYAKLVDVCRSPRLRAFLRLCPLITPPGGRWWYGLSWRALEERYFQSFELLAEFPEPDSSAYARRGRHLILRRR